MPIERPHATSYKLAIEMFVLSVIACEMFTIEVYMNLILTFRMDEIQIDQSKVNRRPYVLALVIFALPFTVYETDAYTHVHT